MVVVGDKREVYQTEDGTAQTVSFEERKGFAVTSAIIVSLLSAARG
jgi:hypothetical protein